MKSRKLNIEELKVKSFTTISSSELMETFKAGIGPQPRSLYGNNLLCDDESCPSHRFQSYHMERGCGTEIIDCGTN